MREIYRDVAGWLAADEPVALATVVETWGSSPRKVGAKMAMTPNKRIAGSVSGGCIEAAVFEAGMKSLKSGEPQLLHYGVADEEAWEVGLACGGSVEVFVKPLERELFLREGMEMQADRPYAVVNVIKGPPKLPRHELLVLTGGEYIGSLGNGLDRLAVDQAREALSEGRTRRVWVTHQDQKIQLFIEVANPPPTLVMVGGVHTAITLTAIAKNLGYQTVVIDPRRAFGSQERFPSVDKLIPYWPDEAFSQLTISPDTAIAMFTHDPKIDDPALKIALNSPAFYIGALGSPKTQEKRRQRLLADGFTPEQIARIHGPIGLEIGADTPEEIALAVMAEIVKAYHQRGS